MNKLLYLAPRVLAIMFIVFLSLMSLDIFEGNYGFWGTILGLFIHNIPVIILLIITIVSWKHEFVGGIGFILGGFLYIAILAVSSFKSGFQFYYLSWSLMVAGPAFLTGVLFFLNWHAKKHLM